MPTDTRIHRHLNGNEIKTAILDQIARSLDNTGELSTHIAYPKVRWEFEVRLYPTHTDVDAMTATGEGSAGEAPENDVEGEPVVAEGSQPIVLDPDALRVASGQVPENPEPAALDEPLLSNLSTLRNPMVRRVASGKVQDKG